jgi:hypothetical protein
MDLHGFTLKSWNTWNARDGLMAYAPARRALFPSRLTWEKRTIDASVSTSQKRTSCENF